MRPQLLLLLSLATPMVALSGQGWIDEVRPVGPVRSSPAVVRTSSDVRVTIDGRIARYEVTERFRNTGRGIAEGTYHYPLPREAVFRDFSLFQGEQELKGEMMTAEQARSIYEEIVRKLRDPALLTLVGHGLVRAQVFPIQPGETRTVIIRYSQLLARDNDALRIRYAAGSRGDAPVTMVVIAPEAAEFATAYSPTHPITESRSGGQLRISVASPVEGDVDLVMPYASDLVGGTVLTHANPGEDGFALLFLSPPPADNRATVARDLTFVVDVSGSMAGAKIEQARTALRQVLGSLGAADRFRLVAFSSGVRHFRDSYVQATPQAIASAGQWVDGLSATGGTNLEGAVAAALEGATVRERMTLVFLLTDGLPSVGEQAPDRIAAAAAGDIGQRRIFTIGVGQDVNTYLLDRLAVEGRGSATYVAPGADVGDAVGGVVTKLASPALVDLRIVRAPVRFLEEAPTVLPDLFFGEELVVLARYRGTGSGPVVIEGSRNGRRERFTLQGNFAGHDDGNDYIPQLWAARRIGELTRSIRIEGSTPELISQVRELGLRYGILTEYTSYLVQEPSLQVAAAPMPSGAGAAREMTGRQAFDAAEASADLSASTTLAAANKVARVRSDVLARSEQERLVDGVSTTERRESRRVGGRLFVWRDAAWTDIGHADSLRVTTVEPFSAAYFALVKARPTLAQPLTVGTPVVLAGRRASLKVAEGGVSAWTPGAMDRFLREFDGR